MIKYDKVLRINALSRHVKGFDTLQSFKKRDIESVNRVIKYITESIFYADIR